MRVVYVYMYIQGVSEQTHVCKIINTLSGEVQSVWKVARHKADQVQF